MGSGDEFEMIFINSGHRSFNGRYGWRGSRVR